MKNGGFFPGIGEFFFDKYNKKKTKEIFTKPRNTSITSYKKTLIKARLFAFEHYCQENNLGSLDYLNESTRSFLALTRSGSIICVGPRNSKKGRDVLYIGTKNKDSFSTTKARFKHSADLKSKVAIGKRLLFNHGPIEKSSPIIKLASSPIYSLIDNLTVWNTINK